MAVTLRIGNIPSYIQESEFKAIFAQLDCQSCNLVKGAPNGEIVGYARFGNQQAANRAMQTYQGWQGFGNSDGLRIFVMTDDSNLRGKREREDGGRDDPAFKQSRLMGAGNTVGGAGAPYQYFQDGANRQPEPYNPIQPALNLVPGNLNPAAQQASFGQASQPMTNTQFGRQQGGQQDFGGAGSQNAAKPTSQGYFTGAPNISRDMQMPQGQQQQPNLGINLNNPGAAQNYGANPVLQPNLGGMQQSMGVQSNPGQFQPAAGLQAPQSNQYQQNSQFNNQQTNASQQPIAGGFGMPNSGDAYDPQKPHFNAGQLNNQAQNQPAASLAAVLGPLLQQSGGLQNLNQGLQSLLSGQGQAATGNLAPQANLNPAAQMNVMDQRGPAQNMPPGQMQMQPRQQPQTLPQPIPQTFQPPIEQLPHDAVPTLYVDGMGLDVTKREMSHIFRPFEGFKEMRMVEKKDKNGKALLIAFAEFETPHQAAASMKTLQDYPLDASKPNENRLRLSFAKPLKSTDPRSRGAGGAGFNAHGDGFRGAGGRNDRGGGGRDNQFRDKDRRDRDRDRRGGNFREDRVRTGGGDRRK